MFAWVGRVLRRMFPPIPPRYESDDHGYHGYTHVIRTVTVNGRKLEGKEADRVSEIVGKHTDAMDKMFEEIDAVLKPKKS